ncbi:anaphase promoting complex subunit [Martiniozyma asiatica (nom. inval.)]|nr:anaphase promoting complex subunit [Martiniozyma asiatica]
MDIESQRLLIYALTEGGQALKDLHLYQASKWCFEAVDGMPVMSKEEKMNLFSISQRLPLKTFLPQSLTLNNFVTFCDESKIQLANSYFHCKEFERATFALKSCDSTKGLFLKLYAMYLSGEKKKSFDNPGVFGSNNNQSQNPYLTTILQEIDSYKKQHNDCIDDPFLLYLHGLVLLKIKKVSQSHESLYQSLSLYPFNWSCWQELISSLGTFSDAQTMLNRFQKNSKFFDSKPFNVMLNFFKVTIYQEFFQTSTDMTNSLNYILDLFPNFSFLKTQKALIQYNALDYVSAESTFDDILRNDPMRLDELDTYSNILYVMEKKSKLSYLAHYSSEIDPMRPETCCIIANYYSVKFDHEKAITYYKRALSLNSECLSAWTLMGHEFVELKNSHAAIESYRRAVDTNNKDFRAWYGLGQAYEVMDMHLYSLYYYHRACALKPMDKRMWQAIGNCCEKLEANSDAIKAYNKALSVSSNIDPVILYKRASLYDLTSDKELAKKDMQLCLAQEIHEGVMNETVKARLWLANYELGHKNWHAAYEYAAELTQGSSQEIEEARSIARVARMELNQNTSNSFFN